MCILIEGEVQGGDIQGAGRAKREEEVRWTLLPYQGPIFSSAEIRANILSQ